MVFRPSFHCSWFVPEWSEVDQFRCRYFEQTTDFGSSFRRFSRILAEAFLAAAHQIKCSLKTHLPDGFACFSCCRLHHVADQVVCDHAHQQCLVSHAGAFDGEELHVHRGFEIPQFQLDVPSAGIQVGKLDSVEFPVVEQCGDEDQGRLPAATALIGKFDQTNFHGFRQFTPLILSRIAAGGLVGTPPLHDPLMPGDSFPVIPVEGVFPGLMETHEDMGTPLCAAGDEFVRAEGTVSHQQVVGVKGSGELDCGIDFMDAHRRGRDVLPAAVTEIEQADHPQEGRATAFLLA